MDAPSHLGWSNPGPLALRNRFSSQQQAIIQYALQYAPTWGSFVSAVGGPVARRVGREAYDAARASLHHYGSEALTRAGQGVIRAADLLTPSPYAFEAAQPSLETPISRARRNVRPRSGIGGLLDWFNSEPSTYHTSEMPVTNRFGSGRMIPHSQDQYLYYDSYGRRIWARDYQHALDKYKEVLENSHGPHDGHLVDHPYRHRTVEGVSHGMYRWQLGGRRQSKLYIPTHDRFIPDRTMIKLRTWHPIISNPTPDGPAGATNHATYTVPAIQYANAMATDDNIRDFHDRTNAFLQFSIVANSVLNQQDIAAAVGTGPTGTRIPRPGGLETFARLYESCRVMTCKTTWIVRSSQTRVAENAHPPKLFFICTADDNNATFDPTLIQQLKENRISFPHYRTMTWQMDHWQTTGAAGSGLAAHPSGSRAVRTPSITTKISTGLKHHETAEMEPEELVQLLPTNTETTWKHPDAANDTGPIRKVYHNLGIQMVGLKGSTSHPVEVRCLVEQYVEFFNPRKHSDADFGLA